MSYLELENLDLEQEILSNNTYPKTTPNNNINKLISNNLTSQRLTPSTTKIIGSSEAIVCLDKLTNHQEAKKDEASPLQKIEYNNIMLNERKQQRKARELKTIDTANELLAQHTQEHKAKKKSRLEKHLESKNPSMKAFCEIWEHFCKKEHDMKKVAFSTKTKHCISGWLKSYKGHYFFNSQNLSKTQIKPVSTLEFVAWCVKHWHRVINNRLAWLDTVPELPDVRFWFTFMEKFTSEYIATRNKVHARGNEYLEVEMRLSKLGLDGDELERAIQAEFNRIDTIKAKKDTGLKAIDKKQKELDRREKQLQLKEKQMIKLTTQVKQKHEFKQVIQELDDDGFAKIKR